MLSISDMGRIMAEEEANLIEKGVNDDIMSSIIALNPRHLKALNLGHNQITSRGLLRFPQGQWDSLTLLNLWGNRIGNKGCKYISKANISNIRELYLSRNEIGAPGVSHISKTQWKCINQIKFSWNNIGNEGIKTICKANWGSLKEFRMNWCRLTSHQMKQLMLSKETQITTLWLPFNLAELIEFPWLRQILTSKFSGAGIDL